MNQFNDMTYSSLLDKLASYTTLYTQMLIDNERSEEFYKCKRMIEQLAQEIERRKNSGLSNPSSNSSSQPLTS